MTLTKMEKTSILISQAISLHSTRMREGKIPEHQSVVDFVSKNIPQGYKSEISIELIDDVFSFISGHHMELS